MEKRDPDVAKKYDSEIVSIRKDIVKIWHESVKETFVADLEKAKGNLDSIIMIGSKLRGMVADYNWKENIWKNGGNSWRDSWHDDDALTMRREEMVSTLAAFIRQLQATIQELAKQKG